MDQSFTHSKMKLISILGSDGQFANNLHSHWEPYQLKELYRWLVLVRTLDQRMLNLQRQGRIGFYGTVTGEEASVIGSAYALRPEDWIFPALRQGGAALMRGMPLALYIAQCYGNSLDVQKGRQMPCHYSYKPANFVAWSSNIGTQLPHAVGMAYAAKLKKEPVVALAYLGDGATSEGDFHAALNFAGVWKAPVVFFCQNNQWAISISLKEQTASESIAIKAIAYGFEGVRVDGNDVLAVCAVTKEAVEKARSGGGPTLIEAVTYRIGAHSSSDDPTRYRSNEEVEQWEKRDPIAYFQQYLQEKKIWSEELERNLQDELNEQIGQAVQEVEAAPSPPVETIFEDVYAQMPWHLRQQLDLLKNLL